MIIHLPRAPYLLNKAFFIVKELSNSNEKGRAP
jgi:hypothetical protein